MFAFRLLVCVAAAILSTSIVAWMSVEKVAFFWTAGVAVGLGIMLTLMNRWLWSNGEREDA